jgi:hypothetical protein
MSLFSDAKRPILETPVYSITREKVRAMSTAPDLKTQIVQSEQTSAYDYRMLFLIGRWEKPDSMFTFRATIYVDKDGSADGAIYWRAYKVMNQPASYFATEWVHGAVRGLEVLLEGHEAEPGLALDVYKIMLSGDADAGTFAGITRAQNWNARVEGNYQFRNRKT